MIGKTVHPSSALALAFGLVACGDSAAAPDAQAADTQTAEVAQEVVGSEATAPLDACPACLDNADCEGALCIQAGLESYCAPICMRPGERDSCDVGRVCTLTATYAGGQATVCLPTTGPCAAAPVTTPPGADTCGTLVGPDVTAKCYACRVADQPCQANGCFGGWWCNTSSDHCQAPPSSCAGDVTFTGGAPVAGTIDANGGKLSRLYFAVVGDTRPSLIDDTAGYPTNIITAIYEDLEHLVPRPPFAVATGDYIFAKKFGPEAAPQFDLYLGARARFSGAFFPAFGNHECSGYTRSNCGEGLADGTPTNYKQYLAKMLTPIGKTLTYYTVRVDSDASVAPADAWSAKLVFVAPNAWTTAQAEWLEAELAKETTYTFIVRHEPRKADTAPGTTPSEEIMARHPLTLAITGHSHTYGRSGQREVIVGNGGAPSTGSKNYGFAIISQQPDRTLHIDMIDFTTGVADPGFHFRLNPDGTNAP